MLETRAGGQDNRADRAILSLQLMQLIQKFLGRSDGGIEHQSVRNFEHGHANWYSHVPNALKLLKAPNLIWNKLPHECSAMAIGVQGQKRPPRPMLSVMLPAGT